MKPLHRLLVRAHALGVINGVRVGVEVHERGEKGALACTACAERQAPLDGLASTVERRATGSAHLP